MQGPFGLKFLSLLQECVSSGSLKIKLIIIKAAVTFAQKESFIFEVLAIYRYVRICHEH